LIAGSAYPASARGLFSIKKHRSSPLDADGIVPVCHDGVGVKLASDHFFSMALVFYRGLIGLLSGLVAAVA
jgi:hypothetical protein